ncbi:DapH/DapD/GlmU-related protein [Nitrosococcus wardiae]|uniref:Acyltransferase n=1 Tax=Nitrosococcus wardiae TaxID=1814290 RepID=A0A4P7C121_9GAMM|nr:DapH/DapD/GlmU-related protein [Nitrosococcus wardiae]QBQ54466.1 acyltransferase [Nitrosococcus wardiae]
MRKITAGPIMVFLGLLILALVPGVGIVNLLFNRLPLGDFRGIVLFFASIFLVYAFAILLYRIFLHYMPIKEGYIEEGSPEEFNYHVYVLFYLILFYPLIRNYFIPTPLMRILYLALGTKLGSNTYSAGVILDPPLTEAGTNTIIGHDAVLFSHAIESRRLSHARIKIGNNVTIGAKSIIMAGVTIEDGAIVAAGAVVKKSTHIGPGELWGGNPAKRLRTQQKFDTSSI